jgi:hypothetical protein
MGYALQRYGSTTVPKLQITVELKKEWSQMGRPSSPGREFEKNMDWERLFSLQYAREQRVRDARPPSIANLRLYEAKGDRA